MKNSSQKNIGLKGYFYRLISHYLSVYIRPENTVLEINPQSQALSPGLGVPSPKEGSPDYLILNGAVHYERDVLGFFNKLHNSCAAKTRVVILYYSSLWKPLVRLATLFGIRSKTAEQNWVDCRDLENLLFLAGYEPVLFERKILMPFYIPLVSGLLNRYLAPLPLFRHLCLLNILIARPLVKDSGQELSVSVVVPARNEAGNIENIVKRLPRMGPDDEIIFVEGNSGDNTWEEIRRVSQEYAGSRKIACLQQDGKGKADAVRKGFAHAKKDILMILDADLSVAPEALFDFYQAIKDNKAEFLNGSRLVYPHEGKAMRFCNMVGNKFFAIVFSFLIGQNLKDTLCGTKVLSRESYAKLALNRNYFGEFDPFGDFDLILGASRLCLKIREVPVRYYERVYGSTNIKRWKHGLILLGMALFSAKKLKFV